ncbi:1,4-alpha-glucan branching enzyme [Rhodopirellula rubra]|uniref:1,4-alpha-glucan branching enzyme n=1 Tax=Aporhodopirellula rubra TaxID=980271 RepID=A0A7W5E305_9BACT|nr:alpha-amylase family glycosyl hydrolase [Aporhodopirellula rubra]MBB3209178.1 1,4-alpha-glucan branching enzyme [Aporhodopirellula rubra]
MNRAVVEKGVSESLDKNADERTRPSGMGPMVTQNGVAFRVWAPHADAVSVVGSFNDWDGSAARMEHEDGGNWFVEIEGAKPGDEYKFEITNGENTFRRIDPRVREVTNSVGNGIVHDPCFDWSDDHFVMPPWNELVIYEMHVGTFFRDGQDVGDLETLQKKFKHLKRLGVNALQIMPIAEFAGDLSWGYNPAHVFAIESAYGGPLAFKRFVKEAHRHGFAVILDVVYNHFGPSDLDLWQFDGWSENDKGGIYFYNDHRSSTPWGDTRPDYGRGEVRAFIRDNAMMWLEDYHVDGLRYDMTLYIRSIDHDPANEIPEGWGLTQWVNREIHAAFPSAITIAEDLQNEHYLTKPDQEGGAGFSTQWDAKFVHPIRDVITQPDDAGRDMQKVVEAILHRYNGDAFQRVIYTESHDEVANGKSRVPSEIDDSDPGNYFAKKRSTLGVAIAMTAPGIPMLFQGQELLQDGWFQDTEELDWENARSFQGIVRLYADLIRLRLNRDGYTRGLTGQHVEVHHVNHADKIVAFRRWFDGGEGDETLVVANFSANTFSNYRVGVPCGGRWTLRFNSDSPDYNREFGSEHVADIETIEEGYDGQSHSAAFAIAPYSVLIFSQN